MYVDKDSSDPFGPGYFLPQKVNKTLLPSLSHVVTLCIFKNIIKMLKS